MDNPLLAEDSLPQFMQIRPEHVEPAVRELLSENRARIGALATLATPTFATVVEPLEELHHRMARTWSPVSHLNAVLNSEALRAGYNACLPLLSAYQTDLAQSEPLYRAYRTIAEQERAALGPVQRQLIEHAVRDFRLAGVGLPAERKERFLLSVIGVDGAGQPRANDQIKLHFDKSTWGDPTIYARFLRLPAGSL